MLSKADMLYKSVFIEKYLEGKFIHKYDALNHKKKCNAFCSQHKNTLNLHTVNFVAIISILVPGPPEDSRFA